jgi:hypothetical protein
LFPIKPLGTSPEDAEALKVALSSLGNVAAKRCASGSKQQLRKIYFQAPSMSEFHETSIHTCADSSAADVARTLALIRSIDRDHISIETTDLPCSVDQPRGPVERKLLVRKGRKWVASPAP